MVLTIEIESKRAYVRPNAESFLCTSHVFSSEWRGILPIVSLLLRFYANPDYNVMQNKRCGKKYGCWAVCSHILSGKI